MKSVLIMNNYSTTNTSQSADFTLGISFLKYLPQQKFMLNKIYQLNQQE
jgi:hypothetical protein